jgi:hypothetical protein
LRQWIGQEAVKRKACGSWESPPARTPTQAQFFELLDELRRWAIRSRFPLDTSRLQEFRNVEVRRTSLPITSGLLSTDLPTDTEWKESARKADECLNDLEKWLLRHRPELELPWHGEDWEVVEPQVRSLLVYMRNRESAELNDVYEAVWGKTYTPESINAIHTAVSKANVFLNKRESTRLLQKPRGENVIRWQ